MENGKTKLNLNLLFSSTLPTTVEMGEDDNADKFSDDSSFSENVFSGVVANSLLFNLMLTLDHKQKQVLLFMLLVDSGYNFTISEIVKMIGISRKNYFIAVKEIRNRFKKQLEYSGFSCR